MVRATGQWKSKKEDVKRFLGKSREIKITIKDNGVIFIIRTNEQPANAITQHMEI